MDTASETHWEEEKLLWDFVGKYVGKRVLGRPRHR